MYQHRQGGLHSTLEHLDVEVKLLCHTMPITARRVVASRPRTGSMVEADSNFNWCNEIAWSPLHDLPRDAPSVAKMMLCCAADSAPTDRNDDGVDNRASECAPLTIITQH